MLHTKDSRAERIVKFMYVRRWKKWRLVERSIDPFITHRVGRRTLRLPAVIASPFLPAGLLRAFYEELARQGLDAFRVEAFYGPQGNGSRSLNDAYRVEIAVREKHSKPSE